MTNKRKEPPTSENDKSSDSTPALGRPSVKKQRQLNLKVNSYKLDKDQERRLGNACDVTTWLIRIAQAGSERSCLAVGSILTSDLTETKWELKVMTKDRLPLKIAFKGAWVRALASHFHVGEQLVKHHPFLISSKAASLLGSRDAVSFEAGRPTIQIVDVSDLDLGGEVLQLKPVFLLDEANDLLESEGSRQAHESVPSYSPSKPFSSSLPPLSSSSESAAPLRNSAKANMPPPSSSLSTPSTPRQCEEIRSAQESGEEIEDCHSWLSTPPPQKREAKEDEGMTTIPVNICKGSAADRAVSSSGETSSANDVDRGVVKERLIGEHRFVSIDTVRKKKDKSMVSIMGVVVSAKKLHKSSGGNNDWTMSCELREVSPLGQLGRDIRCNLFAKKVSTLPDLVVNDVLALTNVDIRPFGMWGKQISGYCDKFGWTRLDHSTGEISKIPDGYLVPSAQVDAELRLKHSFVNRDDVKRVAARYKRPACLVGEIPARNRHFFDLEVVKVLHFFGIDRTDQRVATVYVTDYTFNAELDASHDKYFRDPNEQGEGAPTTSPADQDGDKPKEGGHVDKPKKGGHVFAVYFWAEAIGNTEVGDVRRGMLLKLENIRLKISPHNILEGNMNPDDRGRFKMRLVDKTESSAQQLESRRRELGYPELRCPQE